MSPKTARRTRSTTSRIFKKKRLPKAKNAYPKWFEWNRSLASTITKRQQFEWLQHSKPEDLELPDYQPRKVLGVGGFGLVGLWKHTGNVSAKSAQSPQLPKFVVVKQTNANQAWSLQNESEIMKRCQAANSPSGSNHIVKLLKECHTMPGAGTSPSDPSPYDSNGIHDAKSNRVARLFMEFVPGGDLQTLCQGLPQGRVWTEEAVWRLLGCLVKALKVLELGTEGAPYPEDWEPICHFDLKPENSKLPKKPQYSLPEFKAVD
jgi:serine/threonine protein kinase